MAISGPESDTRVAGIAIDDNRLTVDLMDGHTIAVPLVWYPRLFNAPLEQGRHWQIAGGGYGLHCPDIDEDFSIDGLLRGSPAPRTGGWIGRILAPTHHPSDLKPV